MKCETTDYRPTELAKMKCETTDWMPKKLAKIKSKANETGQNEMRGLQNWPKQNVRQLIRYKETGQKAMGTK